ncbi:hypothetical protein [Streptomyces marianii]|uniref:Uncharacterized protein n=1 Tax=Streptomyces marianii TaxID=1817406 RepID=A0A5R9DU33_9ACTN|nr:hypothetical protein [Streptomyces marianii]TLQ39281.1 hypothetical protein FEF34_38460 [Streptomyces marianii]
MLPAPVLSPGALVPLVGTADFDTELARLLDTLTAEQLNDVETACLRRQSAHFSERLVTALRHRAREVLTAREAASRWPVIAVTFTTWDWDNGWFWCEYSARARHMDGTVSTVDFDFDDVTEALADLAATDRPGRGDNLTVDLLTGDVTW